jgi:hypothetical protein
MVKGKQILDDTITQEKLDLTTPTQDFDAATKEYVDTNISTEYNSVINKSMAALATSNDGDLATSTAILQDPVTETGVDVFVNGVKVNMKGKFVGRIYNASSDFVSGSTYTPGTNLGRNIAKDEANAILWMAESTNSNGLWQFDMNSGVGEYVTVASTAPAGSGAHEVTGAGLPNNRVEKVFYDDANDTVYVTSGVAGASGVWVWDRTNDTGILIAPGTTPAASGDVLSGTTIDDVSVQGDYVIVNSRGTGLWMWDINLDVSYMYTPANTNTGGAHEVIGDPMPNNALGTVLQGYDSTSDTVYYGTETQGLWEFNITTNTARHLTVAATLPGGTYGVELGSDGLPENRVYAAVRDANLLYVNTWSSGIWVYDYITNEGKRLNPTTTGSGGDYEVAGDPMPSAASVAMVYNSATKILYWGNRTSPGGFWTYDTTTNTGEYLNNADLNSGSITTEEVTTLYVDFAKRIVYAGSGSGNTGNWEYEVQQTDAYFSGDGGTTKRIYGEAVKDDLLYWVGSVAKYELDTNDLIDFVYLTTVIRN